MKSRSTLPIHHQQGGTVLGIVIGLVIGLGIAVGVALVINKSATPFTDKNAKAPDSVVTEITDPNKPMYGNKEPAKEAAKALADTASTAKVAASNASANSAPTSAPTASTASTAHVTPPAADKSGDKTTEAAKVEADDKYVYFLQAGAFREQADAEAARARLALAGFEAQIAENKTDTGTVYRVRLGPYPQAELMNRTKTKLSENGVVAVVVRAPK